MNSLLAVCHVRGWTPLTMPAQPTGAQGQPVLDKSRPRLANDANSHAPPGPSRNTAALAATPIASTASPTTVTAGPIGPSNGSRSWANTCLLYTLRAHETDSYLVC